MSIKIYTRTGDKGSTSLLGGTKVSKNDIKLQAYGTVDELNSHIGVLRDSIKDLKNENEFLFQIQNQLFELGSELALDLDHLPKFELSKIKDSDIKNLEKEIDIMEENLDPLKNFIIPGGNMSSSLAHVCRTVCRRAERSVVEMQQLDERINILMIQYLNRLSDYFFVLSRHLSKLQNGEEHLWKSR